MPAHGPGPAVDFVLGDAHGTACAGAIVERAEQVLAGLGYRVRRNTPYAGGYITRHYGRPREGMHALQVEVSRALYMDEARLEKLAAFGRVRDDLTALVAALAEGEPHAG
jgi:N-formylglutamate amidohydrolase